MRGIVPTATRFLKKNSATILTCIGSIGVGVTAYASAKAALKAEKKMEAIEDKSAKSYIQNTWKIYTGPVILGVGTIACIFGSNGLNKREQAMLTSAYAFLDASYKEYRNTLKKIYGEEAHNKIIDEIVKSECKDVYIYTEGMCGCSSTEWETMEPEIVRTFYDTYSKRYFESTISKVMNALYHFNRNYALSGMATANDYYDMIGLEHIDNGDNIGWSHYQEIFWLDTNHRVVTLDDGMEICVIDFLFDPSVDAMEEW